MIILVVDSEDSTADITTDSVGGTGPFREIIRGFGGYATNYFFAPYSIDLSTGSYIYGEPFGRKKSQVRFYYRDDGEGLSKSPRVPVNKRRNSQNERVTVPTGQTYT